ncbi:hypothetical protein NA57DRAFT_80985 [Rhizodiscina lignyota]|uniref:Uncharacterized protein n=1 Tax=Rhizodiscina lignyota TaxID=1504668 RepID=A0A9P4I6C0_9PEZI|nr:hypothetical protein NA57DRAFT_80985 [Rhizodiscina lignyota]
MGHLLRRPLTYYLALLSLFTVAALIATIFSLTGPPISSTRRVLNVGNLSKVNQFYSGIILSLILASFALVVRQTRSEIRQIHPFQIASSTSVSVSDFDLQIVLMIVGASLVPVGTLSITTGPYVPQTVRQSVLPVPTKTGQLCPLHIAMNENSTNQADFKPNFDENDVILELAGTLFYGDLISLTDEVPDLPRDIGPSPNLQSFERDVVYQNIVAYSWAGNCVSAESEISYLLNMTSQPFVEFTFPDGSKQSTVLDLNNPHRLGTEFLYNNASSWSNRVPHGATNYLVFVALAGAPSTQMYKAQIAREGGDTGMLLDSGMWISRVKCTPTLEWYLASCTWGGAAWEDCLRNPVQDTSDLDTIGLDALYQYINAVPWKVAQQNSTSVNPTNCPGYSPTAKRIEGLTGLVAKSVIVAASRFEWGTRVIRTVGEPSREVYIVRIPVVIVAFVMLFAATTLCCADYIYSIITKQPFQKTAFISMASATRGSWWDDRLLEGAHATSTTWDRTKIMFRCSSKSGQMALEPINEPLKDSWSAEKLEKFERRQWSRYCHKTFNVQPQYGTAGP